MSYGTCIFGVKLKFEAVADAEAEAELNHVCFECNIMFDLSITTIYLLLCHNTIRCSPTTSIDRPLERVCAFLCQYGQRTSQFISSKFVFNALQFVRIAYRPAGRTYC